MDVSNGNAQAPIKLIELLEKIKHEQDLLTARVTQLDEVKRELESKVEAEKDTMRKLEEEFNTIQKEIMYVENDIKLLTEDYNKLVECNNSVLNFVMSETVDIKIRNESNLLTMKYLKEAGDQLGNYLFLISLIYFYSFR